jgi:hypothetical protein
LIAKRPLYVYLYEGMYLSLYERIEYSYDDITLASSKTRGVVESRMLISIVIEAMDLAACYPSDVLV